MAQHGGSIRFEDLGEPVQRLLRSLKKDVQEEDMELLTYVSVKDMAKIYSDLSLFDSKSSSEAQAELAENIWKELKVVLQQRRAAVQQREADLLRKQKELDEQERQERARQKTQDEEEERQQQIEEAKDAAELAQQVAQIAQAVAAAAAPADGEAAEVSAEEVERLQQQRREEEEARLAALQKEKAEKRRLKDEKKRKKREARERELQEEKEALAAEQAKHEKERRTIDQKQVWQEYVSSHPLEFTKKQNVEIEQESVKHILNAPPQLNNPKLNRTYAPKCPKCHLKFPMPPPDWNCPKCLARDQTEVKCWQPDAESAVCMVCAVGIGRFTRHHCRSCGRLTCGKCCEARAMIPNMGFGGAVKVCKECANMPGTKLLK